MTSGNNTSKPRIVVGVDGSESSIEALRWAARLAPSLDAEIDALMVWEYPHTYGFAVFPDDYRPDLEAARALTESIVTAFGSTTPDGLRESVREGHPSQVLTDASRGAGMLIVGSRGHGGFAGLLLGSVSAHCAEHAACPVLVVHPTTEPA